MDSSTSSHHTTLPSGQQTSPAPSKVPAPVPAVGLLKYADAHPTACNVLEKYGNYIKGFAGVGFIAHFLRIRSAIDAQEAAAANNSAPSAKKFSPIRRAGVAGVVWSAVWLGILRATTLAEESAHRRIDPVAIQRKQRKEPWNAEFGTDKERI